MKLEPIAFTVLLFFSITGFVVVSVGIHELSHWQDYHNYVYGDSICFLNIPTNFTVNNIYTGVFGFYQYGYNDKNITIRDKISDIDRYTETKAYSAVIILGIIFTVILTIVLLRRYELRLKEKYFNEWTKEKTEN